MSDMNRGRVSNDLDDRELVARAAAGDRRAFAALVERHQRRAYCVALGMTRNPDDASDLTQEAFVRAFRGLPGFQQGAQFSTWLHRIVVNLSIDRARDRKRWEEVEYDDAAVSHAELAPVRLGFDPASALVDKELRDRISAALAALPPAQRAVLVLREVDGLAYGEIAEIVGCPIGTVMSRLFHARRRMQELLVDVTDSGSRAAA